MKNIKSNQKTPVVIGASLAAVLLLGNVSPLMAQVVTTTSAQAGFTFTRDLTINSTGADVNALQAFLISKGFMIPAGPTGFFGTQTRTALASFQATYGISPAAGYFGPVTRARVHALLSTEANTENNGSNSGNNGSNTDNTGSSSGSTSNELKGGEADIRNFKLRTEQGSGHEGETSVEAATATFDVEDGDIRIERLDLTVTGVHTNLSTQPWKYFDSLTILSNGKKIASIDTDSKNDWDKSGNSYELSISGLKEIVRENKSAEITLAFDISDSIDTANLEQEFTLSIADRGIRAVDGARLQQYIGKENDTVNFGFDAEENGDLTLRNSSDNPDTSILVADEDNISDEFDVFAFDLKNKDDVDSLITDLSIHVNDLGNGINATNVIRNATLSIGRDTYRGDVKAGTIDFEDLDIEIKADDTETIMLSVTLTRNATSTPISFSIGGADIEAEGVKSGNNAAVSGSAESDTHTIAFAGIEVKSVSSKADSRTIDEISSSYGTYTLKFSVTAKEDDAFIAQSTSATGTVGVLYKIIGNDFNGTENAVITSSAKTSNGYFRVREWKTETFTLTVTLNPSTAGFYGIGLDSIRFADSDMTGTTVASVDSNSQNLETDLVYIAN